MYINFGFSNIQKSFNHANYRDLSDALKNILENITMENINVLYLLLCMPMHIQKRYRN